MARHQITNGALFGLAAIVFSLTAAVFLKYIALPTFAAEPPNRDEIASEHIVTIFDNGNKTSIKTDSHIVEEAVKQAGISLEDTDTVEPGLDEIMTSEQFYINVYRSHPVLVTDKGVTRKILTSKTDPGEVAADAGLPLHERDQITILPITVELLLEAGTNIHYEILRAKVIHLNFYGRPFDVRTNATTVETFLFEQGIVLADNDRTSFPLEHILKDGEHLDLSHHGLHTTTIDETIPFKTQTITDYNRPSGQTEEKTAGQNGQRTVTYEIELKNGKEISRRPINEIITLEPVTRVVVVGAKASLPPGSHEDWMRAAGIAESDFGYVNFIIGKESRWTWNAKNKSSGAYGLCQALPASKMASAGSDYMTNPITQLKWCSSYAKRRYGSWANAYHEWVRKKWW